jgi:hypothetical protein
VIKKYSSINSCILDKGNVFAGQDLIHTEIDRIHTEIDPARPVHQWHLPPHLHLSGSESSCPPRRRPPRLRPPRHIMRSYGQPPTAATVEPYYWKSDTQSGIWDRILDHIWQILASWMIILLMDLPPPRCRTVYSLKFEFLKSFICNVESFIDRISLKYHDQHLIVLLFLWLAGQAGNRQICAKHAYSV